MLNEIILKNRPHLAQTSIKTYLCSLKRIMKDTGLILEKPQDFIDNIDLIIEKTSGYTPIVRKSRLSAVVIVLDNKNELNENGVYDDKDKNKALSRLRFIMMQDTKTVDDSETGQELSEKQKKNFLPQNEIVQIYNLLKEQTTPLFRLNTLNKKQFEMMQSFVLLSLYVLIPPRRSMDYTYFKIRNVDPELDNFYITPKKRGPSSFVFNKYKNAAKLGPQIIDRVPIELIKIIEKWKLYNKSDYLLINTVGKQVAGSKITLMLNQIFGRNLSVSMLRHIYLTNKFGDVDLKDLKETAEAIGNNGIERMLKYVQKNEKDD